MEVNNKTKFKLLFEMLIQKKFELNVYYSENLLKYLEHSRDKRTEQILETPFFSDLLLYSLANIENTSISVKVFILEVSTLLVQNELQFSKMVQLNMFEMMKQKLFNHAPPARLPPLPVALASMKLLSAMTSHCSGVIWGIQCKIWEVVITPEIHEWAAKYSKAIYEFLSKFVWNLNEYDEEIVLMEVLQHVTEPIKNTGHLDQEVTTTEREIEISNRVYPYLNILLEILSETNKILSKNKVIPLLNRYCLIEPPLHTLLDLTRDQNIARITADILIRFKSANYNDLMPCKSNITYEITIAFYNLINILLKKGMKIVTLDFIAKCNILCTNMGADVVPPTFEMYGRTYELRFQMIVLLLVPLFLYSYKVQPTMESLHIEEDYEAYHIKVTKLLTEHIVKAGYNFRRAIEDTDDRNKLAIESIKKLLTLKGSLNEKEAGIIYQVLYYMLRIHVVTDEMGGLILNDTALKTPDDLKLISLVFEAIKVLLTEYNINWYESVEIISLQTCLMNLLKENILPTKLILQAIDLIDLSIKKFLSPDLALLVESKAGSTLNEIGTLMVSFIQHEEWEIRDSTLQLLLSCTEIAYIKYIPLQKLISDNRLTILAAYTALHDTEFYVQNTALKCLAAATKVDSIWNEIMAVHCDLCLQLKHIIYNHSEGIVRKEALNVLTEIYINQKVSNEFMVYCYDVMSHAALSDLHWEVQISALNFWKQAIRIQLADRGMVEGKFPAVTFCKEKRKIINLNNQEIDKILKYVMITLSRTGCLNALLTCLNEGLNIDVMELAYNISSDIIKILDRYKFEGVAEENCLDNVTISQPVTIPVVNQVDRKPDLATLLKPDHINRTFLYDRNKQDLVIESIVNTNQADLISKLYERNALTDEEPMEEDMSIFDLKLMVPCGTLHPNKFLKSFKETDYLAIIEAKKHWFSGPCNLDNLLDEILTLGERRSDITEECDE